MITTQKTVTCDLCNTVVSMDKDLPEGWRYVYNVYNTTFHICPNCRGQLERMNLIKKEPWSSEANPF